MLKRLTYALAILISGATLAVADDDHDHAAKHNGVIAHSGHHHLELVAKGGAIELFVRNEDGADEDTSGAKATATVLAGGKTDQVALAPAGGNALKGSGKLEAGPGTVVVVSLTLAGHATEQVRFKID